MWLLRHCVNGSRFVNMAAPLAGVFCLKCQTWAGLRKLLAYEANDSNHWKRIMERREFIASLVVWTALDFLFWHHSLGRHYFTGQTITLLNRIWLQTDWKFQLPKQHGYCCVTVLYYACIFGPRCNINNFTLTKYLELYQLRSQEHFRDRITFNGRSGTTSCELGSNSVSC